MKIDLSGKTALVTGSSEGIGLAIAQGLALSGASVIINGRSKDKLEAALTQLGGDARGVAVDLADPGGMTRLMEEVPHADIVVSNLGIFEMGDFFEVDDAAWDRHWQINMMTGVRLARAYLPAMEKNGWGRMIFISSESAFNIPPEMIHYGVSKTAIVSLARGLAKRFAGTGVTINSVLPGPTMTEAMANMIGAMRAEEESLETAAAKVITAMRPSSIIRRAASVQEVANMVVYVASPLSSATTGAALRVDGGIIDTLM
ncbi:SDR family NAD(P)-dependent oxidoreductase [Herbaspirillum camelliae]|uniref:SDR family NAD(P)-dependent oxidoreductase n=1 Tax=Herbaspirillum camelliae TaxID=1892903 RepID=UPI000949F620|nr:SDR family oxidoreductase [Herbaspirillum camelliae]